jgi:hypothetical protein
MKKPKKETRQQRWITKQRAAGRCAVCGRPSRRTYRCRACYERNKGAK